MDELRVVAAVLAAGSGTRFGGDKVSALLGGKSVWRWSYDTLKQHPRVHAVMVVTSPDRIDEYRKLADWVVEGGSTRQASSLAALHAASDADILLVHDGARPFLTNAVIDRVIDGIIEASAAGAGCKVTDTIKEVTDGQLKTLDRDRLYAMQTPQGAFVDVLRKAHDQATATMTDEMALVEALGVHPLIVDGDPNNIKITSPEDMARVKSLLGVPETRTGLGYDVHRFSDDPTRTLMLGGVAFPNHPALDGHSDADVVLHAVTDALLGAAALGDIGVHFPNTDPRWSGEPSLTFVRHAAGLLASEGWSIVNIDITVIAETPKVMKHANEIRQTISGTLNIEVGRVSIKATTNELMGAIGRSEGMACFSVATISRTLP